MAEDDGLVRTVRTRDGRTLACLELGAPDGKLVIHNHGGPSSRLEGVLFARAAKRHGLRLVVVDRPGFGQSSPHKERGFRTWADDLVTVADTLGHQDFGVTGWSEGGPWALAAAAYIDPARLSHVSSIAGGSYGAFGDNWAAEHLSKADRLGGTLALRFRPGFRLMYMAIDLTATHFRGTYLAQLRAAVNDEDRAVLARDGVEDALYAASVECFAQGSDALVRDAECLYHAWEFDVTKIARPVHVWQGTGDTLVPAIINRTVAQRMPGAVWHAVEGAGHFVAVGAAEEIFANAARELGAHG